MAIGGEGDNNLRSIRKRLVWHYGIIIFLTVLVLEGLFITVVRQYYYGTVEQVLVNRATVSASFYNKYLPQDDLKDKARYILENVIKEELARVEIVDWQGNIVLDSNGFTPIQKVSSPDFDDAMKEKTGIWYGKNKHTGERIIAVANPLKNDKQVVGVLRYVASIEGVYEVVSHITLIALSVGFLVVILALAFSLLLARSIINPIQEVTLVAEQMARGNFTVKAEKRDDDEIGKLADTLNYMSGEIIKSEKIKNDFLSSISHELRTPLTSIKGWGETVLSGELEDREEAKEGLEIICKETDRMIDLVEELLDFSRFQSGRIKIDFHALNINSLVEDVKHQFMVRTKEKEITLASQIDAQIPEFIGDTNRLKQVLINLLDNAVKFTPTGGVITITTQQTGDYIEIEVKDNGEGIDPEDLSRVTQKFYKGNINRPGSGLGLSIVQEIIDLHHGKMEITSTLGQGTQVTLVLPK